MSVPDPGSQRGESFASILADIECRVVTQPDDLPAIGLAIRTFREASAAADNLGESGDERDLYVLLDRLTEAVRQAYPGSICKSGCSGCCDSQTAIFDTSAAEWGTLSAYVATTWSPEQRARFSARFQAEHRPRLRTYQKLSYIRFFEPISDRVFAKQPYRCPFLEEGRCTVYAARPVACRMYGYFAIRARWYQPSAVYACRQQTDYFETVPTLQLPCANMVVTRAKRLTRGRTHILPLWIAATNLDRL